MRILYAHIVVNNNAPADYSAVYDNDNSQNYILL